LEKLNRNQISHSTVSTLRRMHCKDVWLGCYTQDRCRFSLLCIAWPVSRNYDWQDLKQRQCNVLWQADVHKMTQQLLVFLAYTQSRHETHNIACSTHHYNYY